MAEMPTSRSTGGDATNASSIVLNSLDFSTDIEESGERRLCTRHSSNFPIYSRGAEWTGVGEVSKCDSLVEETVRGAGSLSAFEG